jgi:hypothetical protein
MLSPGSYERFETLPDLTPEVYPHATTWRCRVVTDLEPGKFMNLEKRVIAIALTDSM